MWRTLRTAVEDGVKDFSREAITELNTTLSDVRHFAPRLKPVEVMRHVFSNAQSDPPLVAMLRRHQAL